MNTDSLINQLLSEADVAGGYTVQAYEMEEAFELENYVKRAHGLTPVQARKVAAKAMQRPAVKAQMMQAMRQNAGQGAVSIQTGNVQAAAQFDITAKRITANIASALPVPFFGALDLENGFTNLLNLPAGVTLSDMNIGTTKGVAFANKLELEFTDGVGTDTVEITSSTYFYPSLLKSTITDLLKLSKMRYSISDTTQIAQFSQSLNVVSRSMFGKVNSNNISVGAFKQPNQFQQGIIDIDGEIEVDKETSIQTAIIPVVGFSFTLSMWVEKFFRQNAKGF